MKAGPVYNLSVYDFMKWMALDDMPVHRVQVEELEKNSRIILSQDTGMSIGITRFPHFTVFLVRERELP